MKFEIYTKDNCTFCTQIKQVFNLKKLNYLEYKLDVDFDRESFISEFGKNSTFPQVLCDDKKLGGSTDTIKYLKENGII